jgi:hypothetical protein
VNLPHVPHRDRAIPDIRHDDGVGANSCVRANSDRPQYFSPGSDVDVTGNLWGAGSIARSDCDLLKYQTIHANVGVWMYDDSVWMRNQQTASNLTCQRDLCSGHDAPKPMAKNEQFAE